MIGSGGLDERVYSAVDTLKRKCENANINYSVLGLLVPKKCTDKEPMELSFLCYHNNCGRFHLKNCTCLDSCCHRWWTIDSAESYSSLFFLTVLGFKAEDRRETNSPQIALNWGQYVDTKGLGNRDVSSAINRFLTTTIGSGHVIKVHRGKRLLRVLFGTNMAKSLKNTETKFNENIFKDFWEAEGRQVSLATVSSSRFH